MTEEFVLLFGLNWQSYAIIFNIVFWTTLLVVFFAIIYNSLLSDKQPAKKLNQNKGTVVTRGKGISFSVIIFIQIKELGDLFMAKDKKKTHFGIL